jgi:hypothetical protein
MYYCDSGDLPYVVQRIMDLVVDDEEIESVSIIPGQVIIVEEVGLESPKTTKTRTPRPDPTPDKFKLE